MRASMYIHFLGTGTGGSTGSRRWRPANLVDTGEYLVVVDCGVGCHYRLSDRGLLTEVDYVFITHGHMDHFLGLPEALFQAYVEGRKKPLRIYAPPPVEEVAKLLASHFVAELAAAPYEIVSRRVSPGVLLDLPGLRVEAAEACHHTAKEAYGFRLRAGVDVLSPATPRPVANLCGGWAPAWTLPCWRPPATKKTKSSARATPTPPPLRRWRRGRS